MCETARHVTEKLYSFQSLDHEAGVVGDQTPKVSCRLSHVGCGAQALFCRK